MPQLLAETCGKATRQWGGLAGGPCLLRPGHEGGRGRRARHHAAVAFTCDGCGRTRPGVPTVSDPDTGLGFCFLCAVDAPGA